MRMISLKDKRGAEETGGAIVGWIIAVVLLALLIWAIYFFILKGGIGGISQHQKSDIENVRSACTTACASNLDYDYCKMTRTTTLSKDDYKKFSPAFDAATSSNANIKNDSKKGTVTATCAWLETSDIIAADWIISPCTNIDCSSS